MSLEPEVRFPPSRFGEKLPPDPKYAHTSPARVRIFTMLFWAAVGTSLFPLWGPVVARLLDRPIPPHPEGRAAMVAATLSSEARMVIGWQAMLESSSAEPAEFMEIARKQFSEALQSADLSKDTLELLAMRIALADFMDWAQTSDLIDRFHAQLNETDSPANHWQAFARLYRESVPLNEQELTTLREQLGFFGRLVEFKSNPDDHETRASIMEYCANYVKRFGLAIGSMIMAGMIGLILITAFGARLMSGVIVWRFDSPRKSIAAFFEAFTLFLLGMIVIPFALAPLIGSRPPLMMLIAQLIVGTVIFFPFLGSNAPYSAREDGGFLRGRGNVREFLIGIGGYCAILPLVVIGALISSAIARSVGFDPTQNAHPLIPILLRMARSPVWVFVIFVAAVIVAPVLEEIIFRGYFYRFLRSHFDAPHAIIFSAALFSGIHPQGRMGFFPLFAIGAGLALLREWRGSLIAPIVAHACVNCVSLIVALTVLS